MKRFMGIVAVAACLLAACSDPDEADERTIQVIGPYRDGEADAFSESMAAFTEDTGITIEYLGTSDQATDIRTALSTGSAPDVALIPQPGFVQELADRPDGIVALPSEVSDAIEANFTPDAAQLGEIDGEPYGVLYKVSPKSLVWYPPAYFETNDLALPEDLDELQDLVADLSEDLAPWCFTVYSFGATGWIVTDWIEDLLLRQAGPDAYEDWVAGDLDFDSPEVRMAMEIFQELVLLRGQAFGGPGRYLRNTVQDAQRPMFDDPPSCVLHRQAGFAENWLPSGVTTGQGEDTDVFVFPPSDADEINPLLVGGELAVMFDDTPEIREFMTYLATPESGAAWAARGGYTGAHTTVDDPTDYYPREFDRRLAAMIRDADLLSFDGSDLMPADFAGGPLLEILTAWVAGEISIDQAVAGLDEERNKSPAS